LRFDGEDTTFGCRGAQRAPYFTTDITLAKSFFDTGKIYLGNENNLYTRDADDNGHNFYVGGAYDIIELFTTDLRYTYTRLGGNRKAVRAAGKKDYRHALRALLKTNVLLKPSICYVYNFTLKRHNVKGSIGHSFDLASAGINSFSINLSAHVGYARTDRPGGKKGRFDLGGDLDGQKKGWPYWGANAALVCAVSKAVSAQIDVSWQGINQKKAYAYKGHKNAVWVGTSVDVSF
jgi:hypothetical protein